MNCSSSEEHFEALINDTLAPTLRSELLAHVDRCTACSGILEELRVVDALLLTPREAQLAPNFTFRVMAEIAAQPVPRRRQAPIAAFLVSYVVAAWMLVGLVQLAAGPRTHAFLGSAQIALREFLAAFGGVTQAAGRGFSHGFGSVIALLGGVLVLDLTLAAVVAVAYFIIRPRIAERIAASEARL
jgi:hypothetical protein